MVGIVFFGGGWARGTVFAAMVWNYVWSIFQGFFYCICCVEYPGIVFWLAGTVRGCGCVLCLCLCLCVRVVCPADLFSKSSKLLVSALASFDFSEQISVSNELAGSYLFTIDSTR